MQAAIENARAAGALRPKVGVHICDVALAAALCPSPEAVEFVTDDAREQADLLRSRHHDIALLRDQFDEPGVTQELLLSEPRVTILSDRHRMADREVVSLEDVLDDPITTWARMSAAETAHWAAADENARTWRAGPAVTTPGEVLAAVRLGKAIAFYPASTAPPGTTLPGLVCRTLEGVSPSRLWIAHRDDETSSAVMGLVHLIREHARDRTS